MMNSNKVNTFDVNLQTWSCQYEKPSTSSATNTKTKEYTEPLTTPNGPLQIPQPKFESIPKIPKGPLCCNAASNRATHTYSIVDDLAQSPIAMSMLEVLQSCLSQKKSLLTALGIVDAFDDHLIVFLVDTSEHPPLPPSIAF